MKIRYLFFGVVLLAVGLIAAACSGTPEPPTPGPTPTPVVCPTCEACTQPTPCPQSTPAVEVPFEAVWAASPHNDINSEPFKHWDTADPAEVPVACAKCHSTPGYIDFLGADGSAAGVVDKAAPIGTTIQCVACHNDVTVHKTSVVFPSGIEITNLGVEARCMECHQGRESKVSVDAAIEQAGGKDAPDTVSADLGFKNIHYFAAAATQYGTLVKGGYEYDGKTYDVKFFHVEGLNTCTGCHNQHSLQINLETCATCHTGVTKVEDLYNVRMAGSEVDFNGNGNIQEGILAEVQGLQDMLYTAIQTYGKEVTTQPIGYSAAAYPYFFNDTNGDGTISEDEATSANGYKSWTPRLLRAAYNYQVANKDPGKFAHNSKYIIELMYDSIDDLNTSLKTPVDLSKAHRIDAAHFAGSTEPFRHWDAEGEVPGSCSRCHTSEGLPEFMKEGVTTSQTPSNGFKCTTCHENMTDFARHVLDTVKFPSGAVVSFENKDANLCLFCHQGRESTVSVNNLVNGIDTNAKDAKLRFLNVHYFAAGASLFGTEVKGAYEYSGQTYLGRNLHVPGMQDCTNCHNVHSQEVQTDKCFTCHADVKDVHDIRGPNSTQDYDGDGNTTEGIAGEVATFREKLLAAIQDYATTVAEAPIAYSPASYPYFFADTNANGTVDPEEANSQNSYKDWTPRLLEAAYNYQYSEKDPGLFAHNGKYAMEFLYDSLADLSQSVTVDMSGMYRP